MTPAAPLQPQPSGQPGQLLQAAHPGAGPREGAADHGPELAELRTGLDMLGERVTTLAAEFELLRTAEAGAARVDLRRVDCEGPAFNATLVLDLEHAEEVGPLLTRLERVLLVVGVGVLLYTPLGQ